MRLGLARAGGGDMGVSENEGCRINKKQSGGGRERLQRSGV